MSWAAISLHACNGAACRESYVSRQAAPALDGAKWRLVTRLLGLPRVVMFGNREYSLIDWDKRMQIGRGLDMAKTLQRLVATSADPVQRFPLDRLKAQMEYSGRMRDFKDALDRATRELERLEIIAKGSIEDSTKGKEQLVLWLLPAVA